jgi:putative membrane protein (TIGR04086 family)
MLYILFAGGFTVKKGDEKRSRSDSLLRTVINGAIYSLPVIIIVSGIFSILMANESLSHGLIKELSYAVVFLGVFFGAFISARQYKSKALYIGLGVAGVIFIITAAGSAFNPNAVLLGGIIWGLLIAEVAGGVLGAILGIRRKAKKSKR